MQALSKLGIISADYTKADQGRLRDVLKYRPAGMGHSDRVRLSVDDMVSLGSSSSYYSYR